MSYLGRGLDKISNIEILDNITFDGSSSYSITKSSVAFVPNSAQSLLISIDGVVQATNFSVSTSTIDFGVAIPSTSTCDFFLHYGTGVLFTPADGTVTEAKIGSGAVTSAKMFSGFANGITEADQWRLTANTNISITGADITSNLERNDSSYFNKLGTGMTESSGIFTFPSTGFWLIKSNFTGWYNGGSSYYINNSIKITTDNSSYSFASTTHGSVPNSTNHYGVIVSVIFDVQNTTTHKVKFYQEGANASAILFGDTSRNYTYFEFIRLGDT